MTETSTNPDDWVTVADAAARLNRAARRVYEWVQWAGPEKIRRIRIQGTTYVHYPDLLDYERTIPAPGRPRKDRTS